MNGLTRAYNGPEQCNKVEIPNPLEQYKTRRQSLEQQLQCLDEVIEALEKNPEVAKIIELMAKANY